MTKVASAPMTILIAYVYPFKEQCICFLYNCIFFYVVCLRTFIEIDFVIYDSIQDFNLFSFPVFLLHFHFFLQIYFYCI